MLSIITKRSKINMTKTQLLKKNFNKVLAFVLSIILVVCSLPVTAIASPYYGPLDDNSEIITKTNFVGLTNIANNSPYSAIMVSKYSSIDVADGVALHGQNLTMSANDYVTVKFPTKFTFSNKSYDVYLKIVTKTACSGVWNFNNYYTPNYRHYIIVAPNTATTGENLDFELWLQNGDEVIGGEYF